MGNPLCSILWKIVLTKAKASGIITERSTRELRKQSKPEFGQKTLKKVLDKRKLMRYNKQARLSKTGKIRSVPCKLNNVNMTKKHLGQFLMKLFLKSNEMV